MHSVIQYLAKIFDKAEGQIEPASSWLAVLSMIGLFGFIPFLGLTLHCISYVFRDKTNPTNSAFLGGMLFLFMVHMIAEGYVLSAGSGLFFYFWLVIGITEQTKNTNYNQNLLLNENRFPGN